MWILIKIMSDDLTDLFRFNAHFYTTPYQKSTQLNSYTFRTHQFYSDKIFDHSSWQTWQSSFKLIWFLAQV